MNWIDYTIIAVISYFSLNSFIHGFVQDALSLVTWACMFFVTIHYYEYLAAWFTGFDSELIRNGIAIILLCIITLIIGVVVNNVINVLVEKNSLSGFNKILGMCFGALQGILIIATILFLLNKFTNFSKSLDWQHSQLIPKFNYIIRWFFYHLKIISHFYSIETIAVNEEIKTCVVLLV